MAQKRKKSAPKQSGQTKKKFPVKKLIAAVIAAVLVAALVVFLVIKTNEDNARHALRNTTWLSQSASNASGDEVDIREVYNVRYSNYQGRLVFNSDDTFELWLAPGDLEDGTHSGKYTLEGDAVTATFDEGTVTQFKLNRKDGSIRSIELDYDEYTVRFFPG